MPQFYPDGPSAISLNAIEAAGELNTPAQENFETPALQGTMQQLLSENLGRFVVAVFLVGVSTVVRRMGILYSVGRGFMVLYLRDYAAFEVCDIFSLKFVTFFPPGNEPLQSELERAMSQEFWSGPLSEERSLGVLQSAGSGGFMADQNNFPRMRTSASQSRTPSGPQAQSSFAPQSQFVPGTRTLGQQ
ncbi:MAG: hypothetical protein LUB63_02140 [Oscillospiraceae bacterium]|nr:hypothetical protein [Oscillospiraceae bacterium]